MSSETNNSLLNSLFSLTLSVSDRDTADFKRVITNVVRSGALREDGDTGVYRIETLTLLFELALYISSKDRNRAEETYSKVLQSSSLKLGELSAIDVEDSYDDLPALVPIYREPAPIELVITEVEGAVEKPSPLFDNITKTVGDDLAERNKQKTLRKREMFGSQASSTVVSEDEGVEEAVEEEAVEEEAVEEEAVEDEAEEDEEQSEEEVELDLEPVRIKKIIYWKDINSGDIYQCLPEDEVGDRVGRYVDGKPVFEPGL